VPSSTRITVPREAVIEAIATIEAAGNTLSVLVGPDSGERLNRAAWDLAERLLDYKTFGEDDPVEVEITARASEIEADVLEDNAFEGRIATLRAMAPRYREHGTVGLMFQLDDPVVRT